MRFPNITVSALSATLLLAWLVLFLYPKTASGQPPEPPQPGAFVTVSSIQLSGNMRTKADFVLRELDFAVGDTISLATLTDRLQQNEFHILNTGLFTSAKITFQTWEGSTNRIGLAIAVLETWYVFPFPIVEFADRNFNVWWDTYGHSLRRLNWGIRFQHTNFSGRRDRLKVVAQLGFTKKYELIYSLPYFNAQKTWGLNVHFLHTREKEIGYTTQNNELIFHRNAEAVLLQRWRGGGALTYQPKLDFLHQFFTTYHFNTVHASVLSELNPDFFLHGRHQRFLAAGYKFTADKRDIRPYPMKGYFLSAEAAKQGIGRASDLDALHVSASIQQYFSLRKRWSAGLLAKGKIGLQRQKQPYYNSRALGYFEDYLRGYEYYVVDGLDFAYQKSVLRYKLLNRAHNWGRYMALEAFREMPVKLFLTFHNELGYANNPFYQQHNPFSNRLLWGTSLGLDLVLYYDKVFSLELSRNHLNEFGLYLNWDLRI